MILEGPEALGYVALFGGYIHHLERGMYLTYDEVRELGDPSPLRLEISDASPYAIWKHLHRDAGLFSELDSWNRLYGTKQGNRYYPNNNFLRWLMGCSRAKYHIDNGCSNDSNHSAFGWCRGYREGQDSTMVVTWTYLCDDSGRSLNFNPFHERKLNLNYLLEYRCGVILPGFNPGNPVYHICNPGGDYISPGYLIYVGDP